MATKVQFRADTDSVGSGSAEFMFTVMQGRGLGCGHFPRYNTKDTKQPDIQFPSRLGFFQYTESETRIAILDTEKLCLSCLRQVVPNGYNFWSAITSGQGDDLGSAHLQAPSSLGNYPPFVQAGIEKILEPVILPIPDIPHAKDAWEWLKDERKPFFLDHLHLTKRLTVSVKRAAERDLNIASAYGISFHQREVPGRSGCKHHVGSSTGHRSVRRGPSMSRTPDALFHTPGGDITGSLHDIVTQPLAADTPKSSYNVNGTNDNVSTRSLSSSNKRSSLRTKRSRTSSVRSIQSSTTSIEKTVQRPETKAEPTQTSPSDICSSNTGNMSRLGEDVSHDSPVQNVTSFGEPTNKKSSPRPKVDDKSTLTVGFNSFTLAAEILSKKSKPAPTTGASFRTKNWSRHTLTGFETPANSPEIGHEAAKGGSRSTKERKVEKSKNPKKSDTVKKPRSSEQKYSETKQSVKQNAEWSSVATTRSVGVPAKTTESGLPPRKKPGHRSKSLRELPEPIASKGIAHESKQQKEPFPLSNTHRHGQKNVSGFGSRLRRDPGGHYPRAKHSHNNHFGKIHGRGISHNTHDFHAGRNHASRHSIHKPGGQHSSVSHNHIRSDGPQGSLDPRHGSSFSQPDIDVANRDFMHGPAITSIGQNSDEDSPASNHDTPNKSFDSDSGSKSRSDFDDPKSGKDSNSDNDFDSDNDSERVNNEDVSSDSGETVSDNGKSESGGHSTDTETDRDNSEVSGDDGQDSQSASSRSDDQTSDQDHESSSGDDDQNSDIDTQNESSNQDGESSNHSVSEMDDGSYRTSGDDESDRYSFNDRYDSDGS